MGSLRFSVRKGISQAKPRMGQGQTFTADMLHLGFQLVSENQIVVNELAKATKVLFVAEKIKIKPESCCKDEKWKSSQGSKHPRAELTRGAKELVLT